jgi:hypothetical protein
VTHDIEEAILLGDRVAVMGGQPPGIREVIDIPLGRPRHAHDADTEVFLNVRRRIRAYLNTALVFSGIIMIAILGLVLDACLRGLLLLADPSRRR